MKIWSLRLLGVLVLFFSACSYSKNVTNKKRYTDIVGKCFELRKQVAITYFPGAETPMLEDPENRFLIHMPSYEESLVKTKYLSPGIRFRVTKIVERHAFETGIFLVLYGIAENSKTGKDPMDISNLFDRGIMDDLYIEPKEGWIKPCD